jgi:hypothetical protein
VILRAALPRDARTRLAVGWTAFALLVATELGLTLLLQPVSLSEFIASRDPISGSAYLAMLGVYTLMPWWRSRAA